MPIGLQHMCKTKSFLPDGGTYLDQQISKPATINGASAASLKDDKATHAWILSAGTMSSDISNPNLCIHGQSSQWQWGLTLVYSGRITRSSFPGSYVKSLPSSTIISPQNNPHV
jgi:hypothetical protein